MRYDYTDRVIEEWTTARPDIDVSSAAVVVVSADAAIVTAADAAAPVILSASALVGSTELVANVPLFIELAEHEHARAVHCEAILVEQVGHAVDHVLGHA